MVPGSGQVGELWCRGPTVFAGYMGLPAASAEAFAPGGWFKTGDLAEILDNGYLKVVDRKKDMVRGTDRQMVFWVLTACPVWGIFCEKSEAGQLALINMFLSCQF